jgi:apolipoprotein N-acyltransferase
MEHETTTADLREESPRAGSRHELNLAHLVMGLAFLGIALVWLLAEVGAVPSDDLRLLVPLPFLVAGGLGLLASLLAGRRRR